MAETAEHIVVCDDEPDIRDTVGEYLELQGYRVSAVDGGPALRELVDKEKIDIVVLDIMMPGEDGLSLARFLRERGDTAIIMLTASGETVDRIIGLEMGAAPVTSHKVTPQKPKYHSAHQPHPRSIFRVQGNQ